MTRRRYTVRWCCAWGQVGRSSYAGERIFDFFTPGEIGHHIVFFTFAMAFICFITFFYMVGAFPLYALDADPGIAACLAAPDAPKGRSLFLHWIFPQASLIHYLAQHVHLCAFMSEPANLHSYLLLPPWGMTKDVHEKHVRIPALNVSVTQGAKWCFKGSAWIMSAEYLQYWGARYGPLMKAQPGRYACPTKTA